MLSKEELLKRDIERLRKLTKSRRKRQIDEETQLLSKLVKAGQLKRVMDDQKQYVQSGNAITLFDFQGRPVQYIVAEPVKGLLSTRAYEEALREKERVKEEAAQPAPEAPPPPPPPPQPQPEEPEKPEEPKPRSAEEIRRIQRLQDSLRRAQDRLDNTNRLIANRPQNLYADFLNRYGRQPTHSEHAAMVERDPTLRKYRTDLAKHQKDIKWLEGELAKFGLGFKPPKKPSKRPLTAERRTTHESFDQLIHKMRAFEAGNTSQELFDEIIERLDALRDNRQLTPQQHDSLMRKLVSS